MSDSNFELGDVLVDGRGRRWEYTIDGWQSGDTTVRRFSVLAATRGPLTLEVDAL